MKKQKIVMIKYTIVLFIGLLFLFSGYFFSADAIQQRTSKGHLGGRVTDAKTKEPLPGAHIILKGTTMGTITDKNGYFSLKNLPVGNYAILITMMGYKPGNFENTRIRAAQTVELMVELDQTILQAPDVIVTASKSIQRVQDSPISVAVISDMEIKQKNSVTIQDALRFSPGLYMTDDQLNIRGSTGYNKGAGSRVLVLLDGVPAIAGDTGGINWDALSPTEIARIEVVKGAGSALYGSNALGGVVNLITKDPSSTPITRSRLSWGYYDEPHYKSWKFTNRLLQFNSMDISHSRKIGKLGILFSFGRKNSTGYQQNGHYNIWNGFGKFNYRFSPASQVILMVNYTFNNHGNIFTWQGPATNNPLRISPESLGDNIHSEKMITHLTYKTMFRHNLAFISKSSLYRNNWQDYFHDNDDFAKTNKLQQELQFEYQPFINHGITGGFEFIYHKTRSSLFSNPYMYDVAAYVQDEFRIEPHFRITIGARYDFHQVYDLFNENQLSPKLGIVYQPTPLTSIRFAAGKGFRAASIAELFTSTFASGFKVIPNLNLQAESVQSVELGIHQIMSKHVILDAAFFYNRYKNMIEPSLLIEIVNVVPQPFIQLNNLANTRIQGFECSIKSSLLQNHLSATMGYTYLDAKRLGTIPNTFTLDDFSYTPSSKLAYRPKHLVQGSISGKFNRFLLGFDYRYISRFEEVLVYIKDTRISQRVLDAFFEIDLKKNIQLAIRVNNLFNYNYVEIERNLAPIRHVVFTLHSSF